MGSRFRYVALLLVPATSLLARAPGPLPVNDFDYTTLLDGNQVCCFVSNNGELAYDYTMSRGRADGFYFPNDWPAQNKTVIYAAGLWLAGVTETGDTLAAFCFYCTDFEPGANGADPDGDEWRVYSITGQPESWDDWPVEQGAPLSQDGQSPWIADLPGANRMLWAVYNDNTRAWQSCLGGTPDPMELEVRLTAWSFPTPGEENTTRFRWQILNTGDNVYTSLRAGLWIDADLGGSGDDLFSYDRERQAAIVYNSDDSDTVYGNQPPALGVVWLYGPQVETPGDSAWVQGSWQSGLRNLGAGSFSVLPFELYPSRAGEVLNLLEGRTPSGQQRPEGRFDYNGDPVAGSGSNDVSPADKRMLLASEEVALGIGQAQEFSCSITAAQGSDRLNSISVLRDALPEALARPMNEVTALPFHFVNVQPGVTGSGQVALVNPSGTVQALLGISCPLPEFTFGQTFPIQVAAYDTTRLDVQYLANDLDPRDAEALLEFADGSQLPARLSANGPWVHLEPVGDLGLLETAGAYVELTLTNSGTQDLDLNGSAGQHLRLAELPHDLVPPGGSVTMELAVFSEHAGVLGGNLVLETNAIHQQDFDYTWQPGEIYDWQVDYTTVDGRPVPVAGVPFTDGVAFGGGVIFGTSYFGSTMDIAWISPDPYHDIRIRFEEDPEQGSIAAVYDRNTAYSYIGTGLFPAQVWLEDSQGNPLRRLNVCFVEDDEVNGYWNPTTDILGGREYLFIMNSDYDGSAEYDDEHDGLRTDVLWCAWLKRHVGAQILPGDEMLFTMNRVTGIDEPRQRVPADFRILSVHPNPFNPEARVSIELAHATDSARMRLFNLLGQEVLNEHLGPLSAGITTTVLRPAGLSTGVYILNLESDGSVATRKILLLK